MRNGKRNTTKETEEIQETHQILLQSPISTKQENLDEMDYFLDKYHAPNLKQDQVKYLNTTVNP